jgi:hypothetical protein
LFEHPATQADGTPFASRGSGIIEVGQISCQ